MKRSVRFTFIALLILGVIAGLVYLLADGNEAVEASLSLGDALGGDTTGYERASSVRSFSFPADHGPHPGFKTEWWYLTGNLRAASGDPFGYQLTIFRIALSPPDTSEEVLASDWSTDQLYMGHLAVTNGADDTFKAFERFSRGAAGLAGARAHPFKVWLENWSLEAAGDSLFPLIVRASSRGTGIDLTLQPVKGRVLQGDRGLDKKGPGEGNASYYYSYPRLETNGTVRSGGSTYRVEGLSWMDREWSTSALGPHQVGWDWFALHLSNEMDLMYYQIRRKDGTRSPYTNGILVDSTGQKIPLERSDVTLEVVDSWQSAATGIRYPAGWRLSVPDQAIDVKIQPVMADQELDVSVQYWEGAVRVEGTVETQQVTGRGYVELTGYGDTSTAGRESGVPY